MIVPELSVSNIDKSLEFYIQVLGFSIKYFRPENDFAYIIFEDNELMLDQYNGDWSIGELKHPFGRGINFEIGVANLDYIINRLKKNNIELFKEPFNSQYKAADKTYLVKELLVQDPDGYLLRFSEELSYE
jgi:catechol 2,3-dioxygenase-like lactoylglutathione lyase family enzyme